MKLFTKTPAKKETAVSIAVSLLWTGKATVPASLLENVLDVLAETPENVLFSYDWSNKERAYVFETYAE